jgi:hypothetical protein
MKERGRRWPAGHQSLAGRSCLSSTQPLLSSSTSSCSNHVDSTDQKHQTKGNSFHPFPKFYLLLLLLFEFFDFILCNDEVNMLWKRSK